MSHNHSHHHHEALTQAPMNAQQRSEQAGQERFAMRLSLAASVLMLVGKISAAWMTGSDAILSDASESVVHIVATGFAAFSLWYAAQPPDRQHPYGHGKMTYFSAGFEGGLIGFAGIAILYLAGRSLIQGVEVQSLGWGLLITGSLGLVNLALGLFLLRTGKRSGSLVLTANGKHVLSDMWTSVGVVGGVGLVWLTGITWLDPIVAMGAGLHILMEGGKLLREAFHGLMERASEEDTQTLKEVLKLAVKEDLILDFHQIRHRSVERSTWVEVHLLMPGDLTLHTAHTRASTVEDKMVASFPTRTMHITTHLEPEQHQHANPNGHGEGLDPLE